MFNRFFGFKRDAIKNNRLCHSDLHPGNVCLDNKGNVIGILDFDTLTRGDPFMEFRPHIYRKKDIQILLKKYLNKSNYKIDFEQLNRFNNLSKAFYFLGAFYKLFYYGKHHIQNFQQALEHKKEATK